MQVEPLDTFGRHGFSIDFNPRRASYCDLRARSNGTEYNRSGTTTDHGRGAESAQRMITPANRCEFMPEQPRAMNFRHLHWLTAQGRTLAIKAFLAQWLTSIGLRDAGLATAKAERAQVRGCDVARGREPGAGPIRTSAIVSAVAGAVGVVFALTPAAEARFMHQRCVQYEAAPKAGCRANTFSVRRPPPWRITLGIGDVVSVTIFEPPGGLFVPSDAGARPGNFVTLPNQIVDSNGNITVPYAGTIRAAGRTPSEVQQAINEALRALPRYRSRD